MESLAVTHCLALWNEHAGTLTQEDKDYFDEHVQDALDGKENVFLAVLELLQERLEQTGLSPEAALGYAYQLTAPYAEGWGQELPPLAQQ